MLILYLTPAGLIASWLGNWIYGKGDKFFFKTWLCMDISKAVLHCLTLTKQTFLSNLLRMVGFGTYPYKKV
ncbi:MAG: hypothetical protein CM1200mP35_05710 [Chloroflexota bacterium]|nr:MAG: hypothetical protein CM1200mP35_05710 [Chloroflexota bacterium]